MWEGLCLSAGMQTCLPTEELVKEEVRVSLRMDGWMELLFDEDAQNFPYIYIMCLSDIIKFTIEFSAVGYELVLFVFWE